MNRHLKPIAPVLNLSAEEEAIVVDEQNALLQGIQQDDQDIDRLTDTDAIASDAVSVLATVERPNDQDKELFSAVSDMAVAGSDADPSEILPAIDSGEDVSTESFLTSVKEKVLKIWEAIKAAISKIWERIKNFFSNIVAYFSSSSTRVKKLRELLDQYKKGTDALKAARPYWQDKSWFRTMEDKAEFGTDADHKFYYSATEARGLDSRTGAQFLTIDGKVPTDYGKAVADLYQVAWRLVTAVPETATKIEKDVNYTLDKITVAPDDKYKALEAFTTRTQGELKKLVGELGLTEAEGKNSPLRYTPHMLGNLVLQGNLHFTLNRTLDEELEDLGNMDLTAEILAFNPTAQMPKVPLIKSIPEVEKILATIETWLDEQVPLINKEIEKASRSKQEFFTKTNGTFNKIKDGMDTEAVRHVKALVYISSSLTSMIGRSIPEYLQQAHRVTTVVLDYATQSFISILFEEDDKKSNDKKGTASGKSVLSGNLEKFVKEGDVDHIRTALAIETENKMNGSGELHAMANEVAKRVPGLWEPYVEKGFARGMIEDDKLWTRDYLSTQMVYLETNFSKKRWDHIVLVRRMVGVL
jgi:hypothetical protein